MDGGMRVMKKRTLALAILLSLAFFLMEGSLAGGQTISVTDLGTLGGTYSRPLALNDQGRVVGRSSTPSGAYHAFSWTSGEGMIDLGTLGGVKSEALAVNEQGQVVVNSSMSDGTSRSFLWTNGGGIVDLGTLEARFINDLGQVAGIRTDDDGDHIFFWTPGGVIDVAPPEGYFNSVPSAMNSQGQIVGWSYDSSENARAFLWTPNGTMLHLDDLGGNFSYALAVNDSGQVVGGSSNNAFFWSPGGGVVHLGTLGGDFSEAFAVNARGQVLGRSYTPSGDSQAFLWTAAGGMVGLGTLGGTSSEARSINDQGQVVGLSTTASGDWHAFLWTENEGMKDLGTLVGNSSFATVINNRGQIIGESGNNILGKATALDSHAILWSLPLPPSSLSPEEQLKKMIAEVESLIRSGELRKGIGRGLIIELNVILRKVQREKNKTACWLLQSVSHQIKGLMKSRRLSPGKGDNLINMAADVGICTDEWTGHHKKCGKK
jgi:probable HAF family extracellular repeat protein